jgi:serine/threonine-protein kinase RsbW
LSAAFQMMIGSGSEEVAAVLSAFSRYAADARLPDAVRRDLLVVLDELLANVVMHGVGAQPDGMVRVEVHSGHDRVAVVVTDNGPPFDPLARASPDTALGVDDRPIGGLGIHLVRHLVDHARYVREDGHNILTLTKRLPDGWSTDLEGAR